LAILPFFYTIKLKGLKQVKWGIVGTGKIAHKFASDLKASRYGVLHAVGSRNLASAKSFAHSYHCDTYYENYQALFADGELEAIYVATPHNHHFENASAALKAGKAVLCEKPLTVNSEECRKLMSVARESGQYLMEGMWTYFLPSILKTQEWIREGKIGRITQVKADFGFKAAFDPLGRLFNPELAGGAMLDIGIYPIALSWLITQKMPKKIQAAGSRASTGVDLESSFIFEYEDLLATMGCSLRCQLSNTGYVIGTDGYVEIPNFWMSDEAILYQGKEKKDHFKAPRKTNGYEYEIDAACEDIRMGKLQSNLMPLSHSLALQQHMEMVLKLL